MVVAEIRYLEKSKPHLYSSQMTEAQNALTQMEEQKSERLRSYEQKQSPLITVEQCAPSGSEIPSWQVKEEPPFLAIKGKSNKIVELAARSLKHDFLRTGLGSIDRGGAAKSALGLTTKNHKRV